MRVSRIDPRLRYATLEHETELAPLPLQGELPAWLEGSLLRTGPSKFEIGGQRMRHWFDGLAMLHRFAIAGGGVSYANRFLQSKAYRQAQAQGRMTFPEFATDPCRALFEPAQAAGGALRGADGDAAARAVRHRDAGSGRRAAVHRPGAAGHGPTRTSTAQAAR